MGIHYLVCTTSVQTILTYLGTHLIRQPCKMLLGRRSEMFSDYARRIKAREKNLGISEILRI